VFNKVQTKKVYMKIVEQVRDLIKEGRLKPGDKNEENKYRHNRCWLYRRGTY